MNNFLDYVRAFCQEHKVKLELPKSKAVKINEISCRGYFLDDPLVLCVSKHQDDLEFLEILVHEFSHLNQFLDKSKYWTDLKVGDKKLTALYDEWLFQDRKLDDSEVEEYKNKIILMELDCEKRAVEFIKKFELNLNVSNYIKKANAYLLFYHLSKEFKTWFKIGSEPYRVKEVYEQMPDDFNLDHLNPPKEYLDIIEKNCIKFY